MILVSRELKHFENFKIDNMVKRPLKSGSYLTLDGYFDKVTVKFYKKYINWLGIEKSNKWDRIFYFKRHQSPSDREGYNNFEMNPGCTKLINQLDIIVKNEWYSISKTDYNFFKQKYPERFI